ncbi:pentatricopeptide repeat (PPR) superfamily protein [Actinidia rufa]|uniref:Pentatricopeptide repeat (PPR) superfamily protein n=1 Tax=Actinidia rufa TaxID=165716 RepID=A0A7J0FY05_9ERIC|nr:pentatricopeptide repeat (PPR) superfamily protein [Actinidia rufa]
MLKLFPPKKTLIFTTKPPIIARSISSSSPSSSSPSAPFASNLTNTILNCKSAKQALEIFNSASHKPHAPKSPLVYAAIIHVLTGAKLYVNARCLMKDLIKNLLQTRKPNRACSSVFNVLSRLENSNFDPNVFGVLIFALSDMGLVEEAYWVYRKIGELPAVQVCNALLDGFVKIGRLDLMWEVFRDMVSRGLLADVVTYGILVDACCDQENMPKAHKMFDEMVERGIKPTVVIYTTLIRGLSREGKMSEAENMFTMMRESGVFPNLYTYNTLMDGYCKMANVKKAIELYRQMLGHDVLPNVVTFGALIDGLCKLGELVAARNYFVCNLSAAMDMHSEMKKLELSADVFTYSILIKVGNMEKALKVCSQMTEKGIQPNVLTFSILLIDGYCKIRKMDAAMGMHTEMVIKGLVPDVVTYTALIDGHFKDVVLIDGLCKDGRTNDAIKLFLEETNAVPIGGETDYGDSNSYTPNHVMYTALIQALCKDGKIFKASKFFRDMRYFSMKPDVPIYTIIIQGHFLAKHKFDVKMLQADMLKMGIMPSTIIYQVLSRGYREIGDLESSVSPFVVQFRPKWNYDAGILGLRLLIGPLLINFMFEAVVYIDGVCERPTYLLQ